MDFSTLDADFTQQLPKSMRLLVMEGLSPEMHAELLRSMDDWQPADRAAMHTLLQSLAMLDKLLMGDRNDLAAMAVLAGIRVNILDGTIDSSVLFDESG